MNFGLIVAACAFRELNKDSLSVLEELKISHARALNRAYLYETFGISTHEFTYIEKCNAILLVASYKSASEQDQGKNDILKAWENLTKGMVTKHSTYLVTYYGTDALRYLAETSTGLHSVVTGDSQVYSQIRSPLRRSARKNGKFSPFRIIYQELSNIHSTLKKSTDLYKGYTSLERLATLRIDKCTQDANPVVVVGAGRSGQLITKILSKELNLLVFVTARRIGDAQKIAKKYGAQPIDFHSLTYLDTANSVIFAVQNNPSTQVYADKVLRKLKEMNNWPCMIIDMASPSIFSKRLRYGNFVSIEDLSEDASSVIETRNIHAASAAQIIKTMLPLVVQKINTAKVALAKEGCHA